MAIAFFNAEEMGLLGSQHFVSMWARYEKVYGKMVAMLNLDMIGRYKNDLSIMGLGSSKAFKNISSLSPQSIRNQGVANEDTGAVNQELMGAGQGQQLADDVLG